MKFLTFGQGIALIASAYFVDTAEVAAQAQQYFSAYLGEARSTTSSEAGTSRSRNLLPGTSSLGTSVDTSFTMFQEEGPVTPQNFYAQSSSMRLDKSWQKGSDNKIHASSYSFNGLTITKPSAPLGQLTTNDSYSVLSVEPVAEGAENPVVQEVHDSVAGPVTIVPNWGSRFGYHVCKSKGKRREGPENDWTQYTWNSSSTYLPRMIIRRTSDEPLPSNLRAILSYEFTTYDVCMNCDEIQEVGPVTSRHISIVIAGGSNGGRALVNPDYVANNIANDTCRIFEWSNIRVDIEERNGFAPAAAAPRPLQFDRATGIWNGETIYASPTSPWSSWWASQVYAGLDGLRSKLFTEVLPAWSRELAARFERYITIEEELNRIDPPPPALPTACEGYSSVYECLEMLNTIPGQPGALQLTSASPSPSPTPTPK